MPIGNEVLQLVLPPHMWDPSVSYTKSRSQRIPADRLIPPWSRVLIGKPWHHPARVVFFSWLCLLRCGCKILVARPRSRNVGCAVTLWRAVIWYLFVHMDSVKQGGGNPNSGDAWERHLPNRVWIGGQWGFQDIACVVRRFVRIKGRAQWRKRQIKCHFWELIRQLNRCVTHKTN
jgi:hypothetical protein